MPEESRSATATILFTDLVSSTELLQREGDEEAQAIVQAHQQLLREVVGAHGGQEVKWLGDGFMVAFPSAAAAVRCAVAMQRASHAAPGQRLAIRVGLHVGEPLVEEADYFGTAVVVARRLCDQAAGGQIVSSSLVAGLLAGRQAFHFRDIGKLALKGITEPLAACEVIYEHDAPASTARTGLARARFFRRRLVRAGAVGASLAAIAGGTVAGLLLSGILSGEEKRAGVVYQDIVTSADGQASVATIGGDCKTSDLLVTGTLAGRVSGDITGDMAGTFEATLYAADDCRSTDGKSTVTFGDSGGDSLSIVAQSLSVSRVAGLVSGTGSSEQADRAASVITGGTGRYAGFTGRGTCTILSFILQDTPGATNSTAQTTSQCTHQIARAADAEPVIMQAATSEDAITAVGHSTELPYEASFTVLYRNNRDQPQQGLSLRVPVPQGVQLKMAKAGESLDAAPTGEGTWNLPDLPAGEVGEFEFVVQLISAQTATISLVPEIDGEDFHQPARSEPITVRVVQ